MAAYKLAIELNRRYRNQSLATNTPNVSKTETDTTNTENPHNRQIRSARKFSIIS